MEKRTRWEFLAEGTRWKWLSVSPEGQQIQSEATFKTLKNCIDDAKVAGYVPVPQEAERRQA